MTGTPSKWFYAYSIVARNVDPERLGVEVQTRQMCVGAVGPWLDPNVGAIATNR